MKSICRQIYHRNDFWTVLLSIKSVKPQFLKHNAPIGKMTSPLYLLHRSANQTHFISVDTCCRRGKNLPRRAVPFFRNWKFTNVYKQTLSRRSPSRNERSIAQLSNVDRFPRANRNRGGFPRASFEAAHICSRSRRKVGGLNQPGSGTYGRTLGEVVIAHNNPSSTGRGSSSRGGNEPKQRIHSWKHHETERTNRPQQLPSWLRLWHLDEMI